MTSISYVDGTGANVGSINYVVNCEVNVPSTITPVPWTGAQRCTITLQSILSGNLSIESIFGYALEGPVNNNAGNSENVVSTSPGSVDNVYSNQYTYFMKGTDGSLITFTQTVSGTATITGTVITGSTVSFSTPGYYVLTTPSVNNGSTNVLCVVGDIPTIEANYGLNSSTSLTIPMVSGFTFLNSKINGKDYTLPSTYTDLSTASLSFFLAVNSGATSCSLTLNNFTESKLCLEVFMCQEAVVSTYQVTAFKIKFKFNFDISPNFYYSNNVVKASSIYNSVTLFSFSSQSTSVGFPFYTNVSDYASGIQGGTYTPVNGFFDNSNYADTACCRCTLQQLGTPPQTITVGYNSSIDLKPFLLVSSEILAITLNQASGNDKSSPTYYENGIINLVPSNNEPSIYVDSKGILYCGTQSSVVTYNTFVIHTKAGSFQYVLTAGENSLTTTSETVLANECNLQITVSGTFVSGYDDYTPINVGEISGGVYTSVVSKSKKITIVSSSGNYICNVNYNKYCVPVGTTICVISQPVNESLKYYYPSSNSVSLSLQSNLITGTTTIAPSATTATINNTTYNVNLISCSTVLLNVNANEYKSFSSFLRDNYIVSASINGTQVQPSIPNSFGIITEKFGLLITQAGTYTLTVNLSNNGSLAFNLNVVAVSIPLPTYSTVLYAEAGDLVNAPDTSVGTVSSIVYMGQTYTSFLGQTIGALTFSSNTNNGMLQVSSSSTVSFTINGSTSIYNTTLNIIPPLIIPAITMAVGTSLDIVTTYANPLYQSYYKSRTFTSSASTVVSCSGSVLTAGQQLNTNVAISLGTRQVTTVLVVPAPSTQVISNPINVGYNTQFSGNVWDYVLVNGTKQLLGIEIDSTSYTVPMNAENITLNDTGDFTCTLTSSVQATLQYVLNGVIENESVSFQIIYGTVLKIPVLAKTTNVVLSQLSGYSIQKVQTNGINYTPNLNISYNTALYNISTNTLSINNETTFPIMNITATQNSTTTTISVEIEVMPVLPSLSMDHVIVAESQTATIVLDEGPAYYFNSSTQLTYNPTYSFTVSTNPTVIPVTATYCGQNFSFSILGFTGTTTNYGILNTRTITGLSIQSYYGATNNVLTSSGTITYGSATLQVNLSTGTLVVSVGSETSIPNFIYKNTSGNYSCIGLQVLPVNVIPSSMMLVDFTSIPLPLGPTYVAPTNSTLAGGILSFATQPPAGTQIQYTYGSTTTQSISLIFKSGTTAQYTVINSLTVSPTVSISIYSINGTNYSVSANSKPIQIDGTLYTITSSTITVAPSSNYIAPILVSDGNSYYEYDFTVVPSYTWQDIIEPRSYSTGLVVPLPTVNTAVYSTTTTGCSVSGNSLTINQPNLNSCLVSVVYAETNQTFVVHFTANNCLQLSVVQGYSNTITATNVIEALPNINQTSITSYLNNGIKYAVPSNINLANNCVISLQASSITITNALSQLDTIQFYFGNVLCLLQINVLQVPLATSLTTVVYSTTYQIPLPAQATVSGSSVTGTVGNYFLPVPSSGTFTYSYYGCNPTVTYQITQGIPPTGLQQSLLYAQGSLEKINVINDYTTADTSYLAKVVSVSVGSTNYSVTQAIPSIQAIDIYGNCVFDTSTPVTNVFVFNISCNGASIQVTLTVTIYNPSNINTYTFPVAIGVPTTFSIALSNSSATYVSLKSGSSVYKNTTVAIPIGTIGFTSFPSTTVTTTTSGTAGPFLLTTSDNELFYINVVSLKVKALSSLTISTALNQSITGNLIQSLFGTQVYNEILALGAVNSVLQQPTTNTLLSKSGSATFSIDNSYNYTYVGNASGVWTLTYLFTGSTTIYNVTINLNIVSPPSWNNITYTVPINTNQTVSLLPSITTGSTQPITVLTYDTNPVNYSGVSNPSNPSTSLGSILIETNGTMIWLFSTVGTESHNIQFSDGYNTISGSFNIVTYDPSITVSSTLTTAGQPVSFLTSTLTSPSSIVSYSIDGVNYNMQNTIKTCGTFSVSSGSFTYSPSKTFTGEIDPVLLHLASKQTVLLNFSIININAGTLQNVNVARNIATTINLINTFFTNDELTSLSQSSITPTFNSLTYNSPTGTISIVQNGTITNYGTVNASSSGTVIFTSSVSGNWPLLNVLFNIGSATTTFGLQVNSLPTISSLSPDEFVPLNTVKGINVASYLLIPPTSVTFSSIISNGTTSSLPFTDSYVTCNEFGMITTGNVTTPNIVNYIINVTNGIQTAQIPVNLIFYDPNASNIVPVVVIANQATSFPISSLGLASGVQITKIGNYQYTSSGIFTVNGVTITSDLIGNLILTASTVTDPVPITTNSKTQPTIYLDVTTTTGSGTGQITIQSTNFSGNLFSSGTYVVSNFVVGSATYNVNVQQLINGMNVYVSSTGAYTISGTTQTAFTIQINYTNVVSNTSYSVNIQVNPIVSTNFTVFSGSSLNFNVFTDLNISGYTISGYSINGTNYSVGQTYNYGGVSFSIASDGTVDCSSNATIESNIVVILALKDSNGNTSLVEFSLICSQPPQSINKIVAVPRLLPVAVDLSKIFGPVTINSVSFLGMKSTVPATINLLANSVVQSKFSLVGTVVTLTPNGGEDGACINPISLICTTSNGASVTHYISFVFTNTVPQTLIPSNGAVSFSGIIYLEQTSSNSILTSDTNNKLTTTNGTYTFNSSGITVVPLVSPLLETIQAICTDTTYDYRVYNLTVMTGITQLSNTISLKSGTYNTINVPLLFGITNFALTSSAVPSSGITINNLGVVNVSITKSQSIYLVGSLYLLLINFNVYS